MFVVDALRNDVENVAAIVRMLNDRTCFGWRHLWPRDFSEAEVAPVLQQLVRDGLVTPLTYAADRRELVADDPGACGTPDGGDWFALTDAGRCAWDQWVPPSAPGDG
jgi:hypothetical protein